MYELNYDDTGPQKKKIEKENYTLNTLIDWWSFWEDGKFGGGGGGI